MRIDIFIFQKFNLKSRSYAAQLVKKGQVYVDNKQITSPSCEVDENSNIVLNLEGEFASQGGHKLKTAIDTFGIDLKALTTADIGCSNGGFTDCMLKEGALSVLAVDVGDCALPEELCHDERVTFYQANARNVNDFEKEKMDFVCVDVSFISLELIIPTVYNILIKGGRAVLLIKPQFELTKSALSKKGIVINEKDRISALEKIEKHAKSLGFEILGHNDAPIMFERKNREFLLYLKK